MKNLEQTTDEILNLAAAQFKVPRTELQADDDFFMKFASAGLKPGPPRRSENSTGGTTSLGVSTSEGQEPLRCVGIK